MAIPAGFEPATIGLEGRCQNGNLSNDNNHIAISGLQEKAHRSITEFAPAVNGLPTLHRVKRRHADGSTHVHVYAWRGGPKIGLDEPDSVLIARQKDMVDRYGGTKKRTRVAKPSKPRKTTLGIYVGKALQNAKQRASKKKLNFTIDKEVVASLLEKQDFRCALSRIEFQPTWGSLEAVSYNPYGISIDRIDCSEGYTRTNIRLVLTAVNFALNDWGEDVYLRIAKAVVAHNLLLGN